MTKRKRRPQRKHAPNQERPTHWYAFLNERYISDEVVDIREEMASFNALNGIRRIRHPYTRVDIVRNRLSRRFNELTQHPDSTLTMLDTDHAHRPETVKRLISHNLPVVGALAFRRSEPYDPQAYVKDNEGRLQQPVEWKPGLLEVDVVGAAALCIKRSVFTLFEQKGISYPWFRMMYEDDKDTLLGEDWYFSERCIEAGVKMYVDMTLIAPHQDVMWIDEKPWLLRQGRIIPDEQAKLRPEPWLHDEFSANAEQKWLDLKDRHKGETCIVIGNGPSLREVPQDFLQQFPTFGTNRIYTVEHLSGFSPTYYVCVNPLVLEQFGREAIQTYRGKSRRFFLSVIYLKDNQEAANQPAVVPIQSLGDQRFFTDPRLGLYEGHTVTFVALQLAYWMGFSKVGLVGVDHRYEFEGKPNQLLVAMGPDPNHASEDYFGRGVRWHAPDLAKSAEAYQMAREAFEADGREIVNLTPGTALDVFEKGEWTTWQSSSSA